MIGPAVAGVLIAAIGSGWVFLLNAASFGAVLLSLRWLRLDDLQLRERTKSSRAGLADGFAYVRGRPDLLAILWMYFLIGTFGLNFPIFISTMSVTVFQQGPSQYGVLTSCMAVGSVLGALLSASRASPGISVLLVGALLFGLGTAVAAVMPGYWWFGLALTAVGVAAQTFTTTANSTVQLSTESAMRGRVMAILLAISVGGTPLGAPVVGWVADLFGPRWALGIGAASGLLAAAVAVRYLIKYRGLRVWIEGRRLRHSLEGLS
jgi:MFS family permease